VGEAGREENASRASTALPARWRKARGLLVLRAPDQRVDVGVGLTSGATEVGVEHPGTELGGRDRKRDVLLARTLSHAQPAGADLDAPET
jgi:hypothetical protein